MNDDEHTAAQARRLAQLIVAPAGAADCTNCLEALEDYVQAQLEAPDYTARLPHIARHLDLCVSCSEAYALVYEARAAEQVAGAALLPTERVPPPDLRFLQTRPQQTAGGAEQRLRELLGQAVRRAGDKLWLSLSQPLVEALRGLSAAQPAPALRSGDQVAPFAELELAEPGQQIERLRLLAYAQHPNSERCTLRISVSLQGRDWPDLAGVVVRLQYDAAQTTAVTDAWGEAVIEAVPLAALPGLQIELDAGGLQPAG